MEYIIPIKGAVKFNLTIDPTVWIFDDRRIDLKTFFNSTESKVDADIEYTKKVSAHWAKELIEGNTAPSETVDKPKVKSDRQQMKTGTFGMYIKPFVLNAEPHEDATTIVFETHLGEEHSFPLSELDQIILKYSDEGKALKEDGPVYVLKDDGSNLHSPIKHIAAIRIQ